MSWWVGPRRSSSCRRAASNVGWLVEYPIAQRKDLIGGNHHGVGMANGDCPAFRRRALRQCLMATRLVIGPQRFANCRFIDIGRINLNARPAALAFRRVLEAR